MSRYQQVSTKDEADHFSSSPTSTIRQPISSSSPTPSNNNNINNNTNLQRQRNDLEDTFGESFDDDDEEDEQSEGQRLLPSAHHSNNNNGSSSSSSSSNSITSSNGHPTASFGDQQQQPAILPVAITNDGVFSNMSAKPESENAKVDEIPPAYDVAVADATPPYWQTTVIAPLGMGDMILVEGLPVGSILAFAWNLLVSASFQFVGFMLTYLLHTSHAAKNGSLAGLGISLVQTGFYIRSNESLLDDGELNEGGDNKKHKDDEEGASLDADILSYLLMIIGWFLIIRAIADYTRAKKMESIIGQEPTPESIV